MKRITKIIALLLLLALTVGALSSCALDTDKLLDAIEEISGADPLPKDTELVEIANKITPTVVKSCIRIEATYISSVAQGSGVIYNRLGDTYFALTNNHVINKNGGRLRCYVYDVYGESYQANVVVSSEACDLAIVSFVSKTEYEVADFAKDAPVRGDTVFSIGSPNGLHNLATYGALIDSINLEEDSLAFEVFAHNAITDNGSSGGGLFNAKGELVGINYAGAETEDELQKYSFAIPMTNVLDFLISSGYMKTTQ